MQSGRRERRKTLASRCDHYVDFQAKTEVSDDEGGFVEVWEDIDNATQIPVEILSISTTRRAEMRSWNVVATHYINSRAPIPIEEVGRVVYVTPVKTRYFYIKTLDDIRMQGIEDSMVAEERRP